MNKNNSLLLKLDFALMFLDCKVILLIMFMVDFYRQTAWRADLLVPKRVLYADTLRWAWEEIGSPYVKWIVLAIIADIILKRIIKGLMND
jgi:hypothetical protein